ncbi:MAG: DUF1573 domain-containing protein [Planctomycetes bacterium]|nr:DUF1573 domain-containing protein [Planctomycetota bacterium]
MIARILTAVAAALILASGLEAVELTFKTPTATFQAPIEVTGQDVVFAFTNETTEAILITDIQTGCGCVTSALEKRTYLPGESGALQVHVDFQDRTGPIKKILRIRVRGEKETTETEQRIKIDGVATTPLTLSSLTVSWAGGQPPETKEILVSIKEGMDVRDLVVENPLLSPHFKIESIPRPSGGLIVRITPHSDAGGNVSLNDGREIQQSFYLTYKYSPQSVGKRERFYAIVYRP